ncbi:DUF3397 family protein [Virgibacillus dakarensis]|nr:DUF3397 family protein [Virgibacillus dakarensis]
MLDIIIYSIAFIITAPILTTWVVYQFSVKIYRQKWRAFHTAVNWTTIWYILAVMTLMSVIFNNSFYGWIIVLLLCILSIIIVIQWKTRTEVDFKRAFKGFWRFTFLLFSLLYICLILIGLIQQLFYL